MKRFIKRALVMLLILTMTVCPICLTGCAKRQLAIEPGLYVFEKDSYETFITATISSTEMNQNHIVTSTEVNVTIEAKNYHFKSEKILGREVITVYDSFIFENSYVDYKIKVGDNTQMITIELDSNGNGTFSGSVSFPATYAFDLKVEGNVENVSGCVYAPYFDYLKAGAAEGFGKENRYSVEKDGITYIVRDRKEDGMVEFCVDTASIKKEIAIIPDTFITSQGEEFDVAGIEREPSGNKKIKALVFKGDIKGEYCTFLTHLNTSTPNLEILAFENITNVEAMIYDISLPSSGVTVYLGNYEDAKVLFENAYFVNAIKPYSELPSEYLGGK